MVSFCIISSEFSPISHALLESLEEWKKIKFVPNHGNSCETGGMKTDLSSLVHRGTWSVRAQGVPQSLRSAFSTLGWVWQRGVTKPSKIFFCLGGLILKEQLYSIDFVLICALDYCKPHRWNLELVLLCETGDHLCFLPGIVLLLVARMSSFQLSSTLGHLQQRCQQSY